jgi:pyruvate formate lyase activating enzyme
MFYHKLPDQQVRCELCQFFCVISEGKKGLCSAYVNINGVLFSLAYERPMVVNLIATRGGVYPGRKDWLAAPYASNVLMISTPFCNFKCWFCGNRLSKLTELPPAFPRFSSIGFNEALHYDELNGIGERRNWRSNPHVFEMTSEDVVRLACERGCDAIRFAYNELTVFFEYALEIAKLAKHNGLEVWIETNGYLSNQAIKSLTPFVDIAVIGIKASGNLKFYNELGINNPDQLLTNARVFKDAGVWTIINDLLIEGVDDYKSVKTFCRKIVMHLGEDTRLFLDYCTPPSLCEDTCTGKPPWPCYEIKKRLQWAKKAAFAAGLKDAFFIDSVSTPGTDYDLPSSN